MFVQAKGVLKKEFLTHVRSRRMMRRARCSSTAGQQRGQIKDAVSIRERPPEAEDRAVPGHWEGDLLLTGSRGTPTYSHPGRAQLAVRDAGAGEG